MFFLLATPEYNNLQSNITKVKVYLKNGVAEIFEQHQDLMGKVENNLVEIESVSENKTETSKFVLQDAVFIVSTQGLDKQAETKATTVYVYAKNVRELSADFSLEKIITDYDKKAAELAAETLRLEQESAGNLKKTLTAKVFLLKDEVEFLKKVMTVAKSMK